MDHVPRPAADPVERTLQVIRELVAETHPGRPLTVGLDSSLERDLGLDSLARVELLMRLAGALEVRFPDAALGEAQTPRELLRFAAELAGTLALHHAAPPSEGGSAVPLPDGAASLVEVLEWHAARQPGRTHVLLYGEDESLQAVSYGGLLQAARRQAAGLLALGVRPGQAVALLLPTGLDYLACFYGTLLCGAIPVPIYPPARLSQIEEHLVRHGRILANAEAVVIITVAVAKGVAALLRRQVPGLREIVTPKELARDPMPILHRAKGSDIAFLQYTSGSTGDPKGVILSHDNVLANIRIMGRALRVTSEDVFVSWLPLYHDMGLIGAWLGSLYHAMPLVLMSPLAFLSRPARWLQAIHRHRGTLSAAPNFAFELCARKVPEAELQGVDLSSWRVAFNGAEPVSPATLDAFCARFAPHGFARETMTPVYGLAECALGVAFPPLGRGPRIDELDADLFARTGRAEPVSPGRAALRVPACGHALPQHVLRVVDEDGHELPERRVGRLQFNGPSATPGYYRNPEATRELVRGEWLDTGDYGYLAEGEVFVTGRAKDLIIRGGRNIYPYDLEQAVGDLPGVRRGCVAVFGARDAQGGTEKLVVLAETRLTEPAQREDLCRHIAEMAVDVVGQPADDVVLAPPYTVLKTSSGKIRRSASRELYESGRIGAVAGAPVWWQAARLAAAAAGVRMRALARRAVLRAYGSWSWAVLGLLALVVWPVVAFVKRPAVGRVASHLGARLLLRLMGIRVPRMRAAHLPGKAHVLVVNHASYLDAIVLLAILPPSAGYAFVAKRELTGHWFSRLFLEGLGTLFVERFAAQRGAEDAAAMAAALAAGRSLLVFPEGTFSREAGLRAFRMGAFVAAAQAGVPVATAGLRGMREILRDRTWLPRWGRIAFELGPVFMPTAHDWAAAVRLRDCARREMVRLSGEPELTAWQ